MTPDKATALREAAERAKTEPWIDCGYLDHADPPTILDLLAERERLRGALEQIHSIASATGGQEPDYSRLDRIDATARQALETTHEPS